MTAKFKALSQSVLFSLYIYIPREIARINSVCISFINVSVWNHKDGIAEHFKHQAQFKAAFKNYTAVRKIEDKLRPCAVVLRNPDYTGGRIRH